MTVLIVYDSVFGNTEQVAQAMGEALKSQGDVKTLRVGNVKPEDVANVNVLIVGSPTRAFQPTPAIKKFLKRLPRLHEVKVAAFDTRISLDDIHSRILLPLVKLFGYAAKPMADRLVKKGGQLTMPPEGFFVGDSEGPLKDRERERATEWARRVMTAS